MKLKPEPQPDREFVDLVQRVLNHEASLNDIAHLNARLPRDPVALRYFVEMRMLHGSLGDEFGSTSKELVSIAGRLVDFPATRIVAGNGPAPSPTSGRHRARRAAVAVAALIFLGLGLVGLDHLLHRPVYEVVARHGVGLSAVPEKGVWLREGDRLKLGNNALELRSADGNTLTFQGPGEMKIHKRDRLTLDAGRLWADLEGEPIWIRVPRGEVTDLGTTFGIDQSSPAATRIDVFDGAVQFSEAPDSSHAVQAIEGESLVSSGSEWTPDKGEADASRYTAGLRRPLGFTFAADEAEAEQIRKNLSYEARWSTALTPSGSMRLQYSPVEVAWVGSGLFSAGASRSSEARVFHTHLLCGSWHLEGDERHKERTAQAKALGLPYQDVGIVIRLRHLDAWLDSIGAKGYQITIQRNSQIEGVHFLPVRACSVGSGDLLATQSAPPSDYRSGDYPDGNGGAGARTFKRFDRVFTEESLQLIVEPVENELTSELRGNISGLILEPVY